MKMKLTIFLVCLIACSVNAFGQQEAAKPAPKATPEKPSATPAPAAAKLPSVKEVLDKYAAAIGGRAANEKIITRMTRGTVEIQPMGLKGTVESYAAAPNKAFSKVNLGGIGEIFEGFDGETAWSINPLTGNRDKDGAEILQTKLNSDFYRETRLDKLYANLSVTKIEKVGASDAYVVVGTPAGLSPETFYFDTKTGFLMRWDATVVSPEGNVPAKTFFEDYRDASGLKVPHKMRVTMTQMEIITTLTEIKFDVAVDDAKFAKPKE